VRFWRLAALWRWLSWLGWPGLARVYFFGVLRRWLIWRGELLRKRLDYGRTHYILNPLLCRNLSKIVDWPRKLSILIAQNKYFV
jgi:hypothetical protein